MDDLQDEAAQHRLQERIDSAVKAALASQRNESNNSEVRVSFHRFIELSLT